MGIFSVILKRKEIKKLHFFILEHWERYAKSMPKNEKWNKFKWSETC